MHFLLQFFFLFIVINHLTYFFTTYIRTYNIFLRFFFKSSKISLLHDFNHFRIRFDFGFDFESSRFLLFFFMKSISRNFFVIIWISRKIEYTSMYYLLFLLIFLHFYLQISLCKTPFCTISTMFVTCVRFELGTPDDMAAML